MITHQYFKSLLLEGAADKYQAREARMAMKHSSFTGFMFNILNNFRLAGIGEDNEKQEKLIVSLSDKFYDVDLVRFRKTDSFDGWSRG